MDIESFGYGVLAGAGTILLLFFLFFLFKPLLRAKASGLRISLLELIFMKVRGLNTGIVIGTMIILLHKHGKNVTVLEVQSAYLGEKDSIRETEDLVKIMMAGKEG